MGACAKQAGGQGCFNCIHHCQGPKFDIALLKLNSTIPINGQLDTERHCHGWRQCMDPPAMSPSRSLLDIHSHHKPWLLNSRPLDRKCSTLVGSLCITLSHENHCHRYLVSAPHQPHNTCIFSSTSPTPDTCDGKPALDLLSPKPIGTKARLPTIPAMSRHGVLRRDSLFQSYLSNPCLS